VPLFLPNGAKVEEDDKTRTALHHAAERRYSGVVNLLHAVNATDCNGRIYGVVLCG
jgi:hypothetical protein